VKRIVAEILGTAAENVRQEHELENDLGCDSLELVEILMETEEHFGLDVPDALGEQVRTVGDVVDGVLRLMGRSDSCRGRP
jgi:acyl carrier protein